MPREVSCAHPKNYAAAPATPPSPNDLNLNEILNLTHTGELRLNIRQKFAVRQASFVITKKGKNSFGKLISRPGTT